MRISDWSSDVCSSDLAFKKSDLPRFSSPTLWHWRRGRLRCGIGHVDIGPGRIDLWRGRRRIDRRRRLRGLGSHVVSPCRRSEEHTSELQSLMRISYAVFCLKKKITTLN